MILVSACLLGLDTRYNGESNANRLIIEYGRYGRFIPVCPEQLGGLQTPRAASEIIGGSGDDVLSGRGRILTGGGIDRTCEFIKGAREVVKLLSLFPVTAAILKEKSPSCGNRQIYDGSFRGKMIEGQGVTAALLRRHEVALYSEEEITEELIKELIYMDNVV